MYKKIVLLFLIFFIFTKTYSYKESDFDDLKNLSKGYFETNANSETSNWYVILFQKYNIVNDSLVNYYSNKTQELSNNCIIKSSDLGLIITNSWCEVKKIDDFKNSIINSLKQNVKSYYEVDDKFKTKDWVFVSYTKYFILDNSNIRALENKTQDFKNECLIKKANEYILTNWWCIWKTLLSWLELVKQNVAWEIGEFNPLVKLEWNNYFIYNIKRAFKFYRITDNFSKEDLKNMYLYKSSDWDYFVVKKEYIDKFDFLSKDELLNDFKELNNPNAINYLAIILSKYQHWIWSDWKNVLKNIKNETKTIIWNEKNEQEKIKKIYDYLIKNIKYNEIAKNTIKDLSKSKVNIDTYNEIYEKNIPEYVQTPFWTYKYKDWVCEWITYLFFLMLEFADIHDSEIKIWVQIWEASYSHAWNKIWEYYYDATFWIDVWYDFYKLPKDLMYIDRVDWIDQSMLWKNLKETVKSNYKNISKKYNLSKYNLLFRYKIYDDLNKDELYKEIEKYIWAPINIDYNWDFTNWNWVKNTIIKKLYYNEEDIFLVNLSDIIFSNIDWKYYFISINKSTFKNPISTNWLVFDNLLQNQENKSFAIEKQNISVNTNNNSDITNKKIEVNNINKLNNTDIINKKADIITNKIKDKYKKLPTQNKNIIYKKIRINILKKALTMPEWENKQILNLVIKKLK